jgi:hypothetical protein
MRIFILLYQRVAWSDPLPFRKFSLVKEKVSACPGRFRRQDGKECPASSLSGKTLVLPQKKR